MKNRNIYFALALAILLLVFGVWLLTFFRSTLATKRLAQEDAAVKQSAAPPSARPFFNPPRPEDAPENIRAEVMLGYKIMTETKKYAGEYSKNDLSCSSCHFDGGRSLNTISLVGVGATYPRFRGRQDYTVDLAMRVQDCFQRSMNGVAPALDSQVMQSLLVYMQWISKDIPIYSKLPWALPADLGNPHKADLGNGGKVYADVCARCHGDAGQGTPIAPPLWGEGSYNDGAGMHRVSTFSVFAWRFMPKNAPSLTQEQAIDVTGFVNARPRPQFVSAGPDKIKRVIPLPEGK
ncbi:c-type cytochrome [Desulfovibrio sp. PG-178-WT-4]|uniref:C-type cytochrome n=1 Tax=Desulfovibrio porci TaxID=2605782 RepID=A0A6L5XI32_9BACT|nr:c-type cytochrome [Desulfovibrio porci]MDY3810776.1 c-type cytochrome [Desulfovibrio porci]MSS26792.1 c-type cytochrome [Desulfovibrio porci]